MKSPEQTLTEWVNDWITFKSRGQNYHFTRAELEQIVERLFTRRDVLLESNETHEMLHAYDMLPIPTIKLIYEALEAGAPLVAQTFASFETSEELVTHLQALRRKPA